MRAQSIVDVLYGKNNKEAYDSEKALAALTRILELLGGKGDKHQLVKMMYWLERRHIIEAGFPMFFDQAFSLHYGPILSQTLDNMNSSNQETAPWYGFIAMPSRRAINLIRPGNKDLLSEYDEELITGTVTQFQNLDFSDTTDFFHQLPEYTEVPAGQRVDISYRTMIEKEVNISVHDLDVTLLEIEGAKLEK